LPIQKICREKGATTTNTVLNILFDSL